MFDGDYPPGVTGKMIDDYFEGNSKECCGTCIHYDFKREACTLTWNNMDPDYYNPNTDDRDEDDYCDEYEPED